jgi:hypothetical protein
MWFVGCGGVLNARSRMFGEMPARRRPFARWLQELADNTSR